MKINHLKKLFFVCAGSCTLAAIFLPSVALAQGEGAQPAKNKPNLPAFSSKDKEQGKLMLPPAPEPQQGSLAGVRFQLNAVRFEGNTVFSNAELEQIAMPFIGKQVSVAELEELRFRLTRFYVDKGYVNSGAIIKTEQKLENGTIVYTIIEGRITQANITGTQRLKPEYVEKRLLPDPEKPFCAKDFQERFSMLLQDPLVARLDGRVRPGAQPGEGVLDLDVTRGRPYSLGVTVDNHRPPSTGAEGAMVTGAVRNLTGWGDMLDASFGLTEGADEYGIGFSVPINANDTRLSLRYNKSSNSVVEEPLGNLDIESKTTNAEIGIMHPVLHDLRHNFELGILLAHRSSETSLLGDPFPFSPGVDKDGKGSVTVTRFVQSYLNRTIENAFAFRSTISLGCDLFSPTINGSDLPDSQFLTWLGQAKYARRLGDKFGQVIVRGDVQLSKDRLLPLEQFAVGGIDSVRGYRENEMVRDNGYVFSVEWRYPIWRKDFEGKQIDALQIGPFFDCGAAWNKEEDFGDNQLYAAGIGIQLTPIRDMSAELYWAHDLKTVERKGEYNLQDDGIYFRFKYNVF